MSSRINFNHINQVRETSPLRITMTTIQSITAAPTKSNKESKMFARIGAPQTTKNSAKDVSLRKDILMMNGD